MKLLVRSFLQVALLFTLAVADDDEKVQSERSCIFDYDCNDNPASDRVYFCDLQNGGRCVLSHRQQPAINASEVETFRCIGAWSCPDNEDGPFMARRCCDGVCVYGFEARCPGEVSCKHDADCPAGTCCDITAFAVTKGICKAGAKCKSTCVEPADCDDGRCCSLEAEFGLVGKCGAQASEYCECNSVVDCAGRLQCRLYASNVNRRQCTL